MIHIFTYAHKRPDFIELQYESIKKHVKCDYELTVFNNSIDSKENYNEIHRICTQLNIKCVDIPLLDELQYLGSGRQFYNNQYPDATYGTAYPIIWSFKKYITTEKLVCIIDSDMFFINDVNLIDLISNKDIVYIPQYRDSGRVKYIWNAFVLFNFENKPELKNINWDHGYINNVKLDVGGQTHFDLINYTPTHLYLEEYSIRDLIIKEDGTTFIHYIQNGNINYELLLTPDRKLLSIQHTGGEKLLENKSFPHELDAPDHNDYIYQRVLSILKLFDTSDANFPDPKHIAFIGVIDSFEYFIIHYKSGSNYLSFTTPDYNTAKTIELKKLL